MDDIEIIAASAMCLVNLYNYMVIQNNRAQIKQNKREKENRDKRTKVNQNKLRTELIHNNRAEVIQNKYGKKMYSEHIEAIKIEPVEVVQDKQVETIQDKQVEVVQGKQVEVSGKKLSRLDIGYTKNVTRKKRRKIFSEDCESIIKKRQPRRYWINSIYQNRSKQDMENMFQKMISEPSSIFFRMSSTDFESLLSKIEPLIRKQDTQLRLSIPAKLRLAITLRFLSTGESYKSLQDSLRISSSAVSRIVPEVCRAIKTVLENEIKTPQTSEEWLAVEEGYRKTFPQCVGTLVGRKMILRVPVRYGSEHCKSNTITILGLVDYNYRFIFVDICNNIQLRDGGSLTNNLLRHKMYLPADCPLPGRSKEVPYVFVGDGAFGMDTHIMEPFPCYHEPGTLEHTFNQRLSYARVGVENIFGVMTSAFRILSKHLEFDVERASLIAMCCILLHNFLSKSETSQSMYAPPGVFDTIVDGVIVEEGSWRHNKQKTNIKSLKRIPQNASETALDIRLEFANYFHTST